MGIDRKTTLTDLRTLAERGVIEAEGTTTDRRYAVRRDEVKQATEGERRPED